MLSKKELQTRPFIATKSLTNDLGIGIITLHYECGEGFVFYAFSNPEGRSSVRKSKIYFNAKSDSYFKVGKRRFYIDDFLRDIV